ncbi:MAG: ABC transporter ATP-binding protein/permease [Roseburia sp.]|nr:ABC transporter ATP-binding protein/permease [Anaeroplasma bactoclasticum]MCM1195468.1 ABC transporter ATP-binding protein/permease [Roseburia sp.]MCM1555946.1 ABC transporter ATP-binding protein/permease [Anaeroplasma bactoclasticum]
MIRIVNLNKFYNKNKSNELHVINNTTLEIQNTGLVTFLGASGAGKSTLLHVIGGLDKATGDIFYDDFNIMKVRTAKLDKYRNANIGYVFQNYNLLPNLTVYENMKMQLDLLDIDNEQQINQAIRYCLELVNMRRYERRNVSALSGGQQQRVAIARALVKGAKMIIADEPTGNLDSKNSIEIMNILKQLSKHILVVLVTHDRNLAMHYSDRIIELVDGKIISDSLNQNDNTLLHVDSNALYLDAYKKLTNELDQNKLQIYSNTDEPINIDIVIEKNMIYIRNNSSIPLKIIGENTDKYLMESAPKAEKLDENFKVLEPIKITPSPKRSFAKWKKKLKQSLYEFFFHINKRTKFLYASFILIGIILCLCVNSLNLCLNPDSNLFENSSVDTLKVFPSNANVNNVYGATFETNEILEILDNENILGVADYLTSITFDCRVIGNRKITASIKNHIYITCNNYFEKQYTLENNEIIISNKLADSLIEYLSPYGYTSYSKLINLKLETAITNYYTGEIIIKEIIKTNNNSIILSDDLFFADRHTKLAGNYIQYSVLENTDANLTNIVYAPPIDLTQRTIYKVYISENLWDDFYYYDPVLKKYFTSSNCFDIVGILPNASFQIVFQTQEGLDYMIRSSIQTDSLIFKPYDAEKIKIVEGEMPKNSNEILLPYNSFLKRDYPLESEIDYGLYLKCKVVGYYEATYPDEINYIYCPYTLAYKNKVLAFFSELMKKENKEIDFYVKDYEEAKKYFIDIGYPSEITTEYLIHNNLNEKLLISQITLSITASIIVVMLVFIFFINRSKMIHNIYSIGVLRALGASKFKIVSQYIVQSVLLTTFTIAIGFTIMYLLSLNLNRFLAGFAFDFYLFVLIIIGIYLIMIIAAITPIVSLLKKTPIEIIAKYDI